MFGLFNFTRYMRVYPDNMWKFHNNALALMCPTLPEMQARGSRIGSKRDELWESSCLAHNSSEGLALVLSFITLDSNCLTLTTLWKCWIQECFYDSMLCRCIFYMNFISLSRRCKISNNVPIISYMCCTVYASKELKGT